MLSTRMIFSLLSVRSIFRSPLMVMIPSATAILTSSFLTSGSSSLMRYSFSLSLILASGSQFLPALSSREIPFSGRYRGENLRNAFSISRNGSQCNIAMLIPPAIRHNNRCDPTGCAEKRLDEHQLFCRLHDAAQNLLRTIPKYMFGASALHQRG